MTTLLERYNALVARAKKLPKDSEFSSDAFAHLDNAHDAIKDPVEAERIGYCAEDALDEADSIITYAENL